MNNKNSWSNYELTRIAPKSITELSRQFEFHFSSYIKDLSISEENKSFLKYLVKSKWWIIKLLNDVYQGKIDLNSQKKISLEVLKKFLEDISKIGQTIYDNNIPIQIEQRLEWWIIVERVGKYYFNNENVQTKDMIHLEEFFRYYLVKKYIPLSENSKQELEKQFTSYLLSNFIKDQLLLYVLHAQLVLKIEKCEEVTQLLLLLIKNSTQFNKDQIKNFIHWIEKLFFMEKSDTAIKKLETLIKNIFPKIYILEDTKYKVKAILLWEYDKNDISKSSFRLIPEDNFYFRKYEEIKDTIDIFPEQWNMILNGDNRIEWLKDICIFDTFWNKVFWWDIWKDDIWKIKWTYYILSQSEWWREAPEYAKGNIISLFPVKNIIWESRRNENLIILGIDITKLIPVDVPYLLPEYVRALAKGKIENWKYIKNPRKIDI